MAPSRMFTYPTRLAAAWEPRGLEINLPGYSLARPALDAAVRSGSAHAATSGRRLRHIFDKVRPGVTSPTHVFDARFDTDRNIAHILTNVAPGLLLARQSFAGITVILRSNASTLGKQAYGLLGFPVLCTDRAVSGQVVVASDARNGAYEAWYPQLFGALEFPGYESGTPSRVFISRRHTRRVINEEEIEAVLSKLGFQKFYFEDMPLAAQWSVARNANVIAGIHGAALSSLVFNRNQVKVVEFFHPGYVVDMYRHLTNALGGSWCAVTGRMPANLIRELDEKLNSRGFAASAMLLDTGAVHQALAYLGIT